MFSSHEKEIYDNLIRVVGSEMDVRIRQKMFPIMDKICNKMHSEIIKISSGSLAEGLDLPGSDMDMMFVLNCVQFIQNVQHMKRSPRHSTILLDDDMEIPGYSRIKLIAESDHKYIFTKCFDKTKNGTFLSSVSFLRKFIEVIKHQKVAHGPCFSNKDESVDTACCFRLPTWPRQAEQWLCRHRPGQWPSEKLIDDIVKNGCTLVPIGPKEIENSELLWRISFSVAEKQLSHAMNYTQILCYALLKLSLKNIIDRNGKVNGLLCSYFMKTALFWLSEEISTNAFQLKKLFHCYFLCLDKLITWVKGCYCPNYFIPENNMFRGKINRSNSSQLLHVLEKLRNGEREVFAVTALFNSEAVLYEPCIKLETFVYRVLNTDIRVGLGNEITTLSFIKSLAMSQSTGILSGICNYHYARASQMIVQKLPVPTTNRHNAHVIRRYHKHLQDGTKTDAVSGWLLYASFYYIRGQYNTTLKIIDYVLSRCTPDMLEIGDDNYTTDDIKYYTQNVGCSKITLNEKMRLATVDGVGYVEQSTLIPHELKLVVQDEEYFSVPPIVLSHCLRFICYHHLNNIDNRQQSLRDLNLVINEKYSVGESKSSELLTILGVCNEIVGEIDTAYLCYDAALQDEYDVCSTAAILKENLNIAGLVLALIYIHTYIFLLSVFDQGMYDHRIIHRMSVASIMLCLILCYMLT